MRKTFRALATVAAASALVATSSVAAAQNPAAKLSLSQSSAVRAGTPVNAAGKQAGGFPFLIVFVVIAAGLGLYFAVDGDDSDSN